MQPHLLVTVKKDETGTTAILISAELLRTSGHLKQPDASAIYDYLRFELAVNPQDVHDFDDLTKSLASEGLEWANMGVAVEAFKKSLAAAHHIGGIDSLIFEAAYDAERIHRICDEQLSAITNGLGLRDHDLYEPVVNARVITDKHLIYDGKDEIGKIEVKVIATPNEPGVAVISVKDIDGMLVWEVRDADVSPEMLRSSNDRHCAACVIAAWLDDAIETPDNDDLVIENPFGAAWMTMNREPLQQVQHELAGITRERGQGL